MKNNYKIFASIFVMLAFLLINENVFAQPANFRGAFNTWGCNALTDRGVVKAMRFQENTTGSRDFKLDQACDWVTNWGSGGNITLNTRNNGIMFTGGVNSNYSATNGNYYTLIVKDGTGTLDISILETAYNPNTITAVSHSPATPNSSQTVDVTATLSGTLNANEYAFVRYSNDGWSTSSLVEMSFSAGTDYTASIPTHADGTTVEYYILTSNDNTFAAADADYFSLEYDDNGGIRYSYTVNNSSYTTAQDGDWETPATWTCGCVPPAGAITQINHAVTVTTNVTDNPSSIEITAGNSITFGASGQIATTTLTNDGTIDMTAGGLLTINTSGTLTNNSTFTAGTGEVFFAGTATVSGAITFYNASIAGGVNFGASSAIDNILQIYGGGYLDVNSITYNENSTLKFAANYTLNAGDKSWYSNVGSSGSAQEGIPWNVEIPAGISVKLNDVQQYDMNGDLTINGTFELGEDGGSNWGDLALRGDFTYNIGGTFNNNGRSVKFIGTANQNIDGTQIPTFAYLEVNNSAGLTLLQEINVSAQFSFTNGKTTLGDYNANIGTSTISGYDASKYFVTNGNGYLVVNVAGAEKTFPVGTASTYAPAFLTQGGTAENLFVRVKQGYDNATSDDDFTVNLQWTLDEETAGLNDITTKFQWTSGDENTYFDNQGDVEVARYIGAYTRATATADAYWASATGMTDDISAEIPFIVGNTMAFAANGYRTAQNGDWATGSTWVGGVVPPANSICAILHHVTASSALNDADAVSIYADKSVTFQAGSSLTVNGTLSNNGMLKTEDASVVITINGDLKNASGASANMVGAGTLSFTDGSTFTNNGTFTAGAGTVEFLGAGTASGTLTFNNLSIDGNVDVGNAATLNNILTLSGTGDLINNSITYETGSTLKFDRIYTLGDNKIWARNSDANGSAQNGIPWNVEVAATRTVSIGDNQFRAINGNLVINGTFETGAAAGGDFRLKGDFENNGTYTHNSRQVTFYGNQNQKITGANPTTFAWLKIDNVSNVILENNCTANNQVDLTNGKLILGANNLTIASGGNIANSSSTKYVVTNGNGYLQQEVGTGEITFPVGTLTSYNPAFITKASVAENIKVKVQNSVDNAVNDPTRIVNMQWTVDDETANADDITVRLQWHKDNDETSNFDRNTNLEIAYYSGSYTNASATLSNFDPYFTATQTVSSTLTNSELPFIVANDLAFVGGVATNGTGGGDWNVGGTWLSGTVPADGSTILIQAGDVVDLDVSPTVASISIEPTATLNCGANTITVNNGGAISNSGTFNAGTGEVVFSAGAATSTISTGSITFNDVELNCPVNFGSSTTIGGILTLNSGGSVRNNAPVYASSSTLKYNQGGNIARADEWQYNLSIGDPGYPANVTISNNTVLDVDADNNDDAYYQTRFLNGNLTVEAGSEITLNDMGGGVLESQICGVYATGDIVNAGTIRLSTAFGGDMMLEGDLTNTGTIVWNNRAIFFTAENDVNQNVTGVAQIPFVLITRGANVILNNDVEVNGGGTEFITFARPSSTNTGSIDLNGNTLSCTGAGNIELNNISGAEVVGTGRVEVSGGNAQYNGTSSGTLSFGPDVTLAINGGTMTFPSTLGIVTVEGTLEVGDGATISNIPTYGANSTLHYRKSGTFNVAVEWGPGSANADNIPHNVTVSKGYPSGNASELTLNSTRTALGVLTVEESATMNVAANSGQLTVTDLTVDLDGSFILKSENNNSAAGSVITLGTVTDNGTMTAERWVSQKRYTYITPPNIETNTQIFTNNPSGTFNPNFYSYNQAFEAPANPATATYAEWDLDVNQFANAWVEAHDGEGGSGNILSDPAKGYAYYNDVTRFFEFEGEFNSGSKTINLTYDSNDGNGDYFDGWNLIANPYPSALDWDDASWTKAGLVDAAVYYWDGTFANEGNYKYYVSSGDYTDGTDVVNGGSQMIPASQAVFVKANPAVGSGGQNLTVPNNARIHSTQNFWTKSATKGAKTANGFIRLQATANNISDELVVRYIPEATENYDGQYDAYKLYSRSENVPQIYSYNEELGAGFAINSLPTSEMQYTVSIGVQIAKHGETPCQIELTEFDMNGNHIYLEDTEEMTTQNLVAQPIYSYVIEDSSDTRERFFINYEANEVPQMTSSLPDYEVDFGTDVIYSVNTEIFADQNEGDVLTFTAQKADGNNLPNWLHFDNKTNTFYGTPEIVESFRVVLTATDLFGESVSGEFQFTVNPTLAQVVTDEISKILQQSATLSGTLHFAGGVDIDEVGFCWATTSNPDLSDNTTSEILTENSFSSVIEGLEANTFYYVRSYATNEVGTQYGNELGFSTLTTSIFENENEADVVFVYPNPSNGKITLVSNDKQIKYLTVNDISGKQIKVVQANSISQIVDLSQLVSGIYFVRIVTDQKVYSEKIILK